MPKVKNQHVDPQFYLRRFTDHQGHIWVFNKITKRSYGTDVRNAASEGYFYDFSDKVMEGIMSHLAQVPESELSPETRRRLLDPQIVEKELSRMETEFAVTLDEVLHAVETTGSFTQDQQERMAHFLTVQLLRGPVFRAVHIERMNKMTNEFAQMAVAMKFGEDAVGRVSVSIDEGHIQYEHARALFDPEVTQTYVDILLSHFFWHVGVNDTGQPLYTSDNPVIMRSHLAAEAYGIGSPGIEIMFPLSPRHILILGEREQFPGMALVDRKTTVLRPENVLYYNSGQVLQSYRDVYSSTSDFLLAVDVCARNPHVCIPDRERIQVIGGVTSRAAQRRQDTIPTDMSAT